MRKPFEFTDEQKELVRMKLCHDDMYDIVEYLSDICDDAIEQVISERGDGWVSCAERLPEKKKQVSIQVTNNSACIGYIHERGHWIIQSLTSSYQENAMHKVTHWQPLPNQHKTESK